MASTSASIDGAATNSNSEQTKTPTDENTSTQSIFTPLKNLHQSMQRCSIGVKVTRAWEVSTRDAFNWEFILIDEEGTQIHGKIPMVNYRTYNPILVEGKEVKIENFRFVREQINNNYLPLPQKSCIELNPDTKITLLNKAITFPPQKFSFVDFNDLSSRLNQFSYLTDVIGVLASTRKTGRKTELTIYNARNQFLNIALWDKPEDFIPPSTEPSDILIITSTQVKLTNGFISLTSSKATKIYANMDMPETAALRDSITQHPPVNPRRRILHNHRVQNISYIRNMLTKSSTEAHTCKAIVSEIDHSRGWNYISCSQCKRKLRAKNPDDQSTQNWCNKCYKRVAHSDISLMIHLRIKDSTDEVAATAFEDVITEITSQTKDQLLKLENHFGTDAVINKLDEIVDTEYYIHVKSTDYRDVNRHRTLTILAMTPTGNSPQKRRRINE